MTHTLHHLSGAPLARRLVALVTASAVVSGVACKDSNVPFLTAPTSVAASPAGIQNALGGMFAGSRVDMNNGISGFLSVAVGMARDGAIFTNTEPRTVQYPIGVLSFPHTSGSVWAQEYQNIRQGQQILAALPNVSPTYSPAQQAALNGVVQTMIAYNYLLIAEVHDTNGLAILTPQVTLGTPAPAVCLKDAWSYIVAYLDTAEKSLETAGAVAPPVALPNGFQGVGAASGPANTVGSFASFNRALAAKARLEWAYAIARANAGSAPTPSSAGAPNLAALNAAMADLDSSAMYDSTGGVLAPTVTGGFKPDAHTVMHDYSAASGDLINPVFNNIGTEAVLNDFLADVDTAHDLRFKAKFIHNPNPVQQQLYNPVALTTVFDAAIGHDTTYSYLYFMYPNTGSPIPILRAEGLTLIAAQIQMGLGNFAKALALVNQVRTVVGGLAPLPASVASSYTTMRDALMKEQRSSMSWESSADRVIAIRMYGLATVADTTWGTPGQANEDPNVTTGDTHVTMEPIPATEIDGRGGTFTTTCTSTVP
jgi:hypothetical protein